jgi:hypothetical protein
MSTNPNRPVKAAPPKPASRPAPARPAAKPAAGATAAAAGAAAPIDGDDEIGTEFPIVNAGISSGVSFFFHFCMFILLAFLVIDNVDKGDTLLIVAEEEVPEEEEEIEEFKVEELDPVEVDQVVTEVVNPTPTVLEEVPQEVTEITPATDFEMAAINVELVDFADQTAPRNDLMAEVGALTGTGVSGRGAAVRGKMVKEAGGSEASEAAVAMALAWIAAHQLPDGGWNFDHTLGPGVRASPNPGTGTKARNGATAMALLPFLGAGQTHKDGKYKENVRGGLYYLVANMKVKNGTGSFEEPEGRFYSHGLASIALCEAYAMTHDKELMGPAQLCVNHIVYAQDPVGGGWRYEARQAGDTSVVGWQLMALKSAHMAYLQVPPQTIRNATKFLDSVQSNSGATYGYTGPGSGKSTTAVGLLCRMYLGWKHDHPGLEKGVPALGAPSLSPNGSNMYFNYYATQVMRHYEGEEWKKWNEKMRDPLIEMQSKAGPTKGSWHMRGDHGADRGGRLYCTSMATMMLEVYYRHLPIYRKAAAEEDFPL